MTDVLAVMELCLRAAMHVNGPIQSVPRCARDPSLTAMLWSNHAAAPVGTIVKIIPSLIGIGGSCSVIEPSISLFGGCR